MPRFWKEVASILVITVAIVGFSLSGAGRTPAPPEPAAVAETPKIEVAVPAPRQAPVETRSAALPTIEPANDREQVIAEERQRPFPIEQEMARLADEIAEIDASIDLDVSNLDYEVFKLQSEDDFLRLMRDSEIPSALDDRP